MLNIQKAEKFDESSDEEEDSDSDFDFEAAKSIPKGKSIPFEERAEASEPWSRAKQ